MINMIDKKKKKARRTDFSRGLLDEKKKNEKLFRI